MALSVIPMPAASIYTVASAASNLEEKENRPLVAVIYSGGEHQWNMCKYIVESIGR